MDFNRRHGIAWQTDLYLNLLRILNEENMIVDVNTYSSISIEKLSKLSKAVFPKYGNRKAYQDKVRLFLQYYFESIATDQPKLAAHAKSIDAPEHAEWLYYKKALVESLCLPSIRQYVEKFIENFNYKLPLAVRTLALRNMYSMTENESIEPWKMKKLNNCLWFNRTEICKYFQVISSASSLVDSNGNGNICFNGFSKDDLLISKINRQKLTDVQSKLDTLLTIESSAIDSTKILKEKNILDDNSISEACNSDMLTSSKLNHKSKNRVRLENFQKRSAVLHDYTSRKVIDFFTQKGTTSQTELLKKLIILSLISLNNDALKKYMNGTGRISRSTKTIILQSIYDENLSENHYSTLDLIILKRYFIKQKVQEISDLLKKNNIDFLKEIEGMAFFCDVEPTFYEVLGNIRNKTSE